MQVRQARTLDRLRGEYEVTFQKQNRLFLTLLQGDGKVCRQHQAQKDELFFGREEVGILPKTIMNYFLTFVKLKTTA